VTTFITPIIETVIKSSLILGVTFASTMLLRRQSAALRHMTWTIGLLCSLALPMFSIVLPTWRVAPTRAVQPSEIVSAHQSAATASTPTTVSEPAATPVAPSRLTPERALLFIWMIGILSVASLLLREGVRLARVAFGASIVQQSSWRALVCEVSHALALTRRIRLMRNPHASVLGTWGTLRPRVLLPRESESWSSERMRVVLGHELAHVKRNDWLIQIIAETARAIYWFNPLYWIACTHLRRESEHACDDAAMNLGGSLEIDGPTYAGHVLDLARTLNHPGQPASAALAMASTSNLERRLIAMLNPSLNRNITGMGTIVVVVLIALGLTLPLAALSSQAPIQEGSVSRTVEFVSPTPIPAAALTVVAQPVTPRPAARSAVVVAPASRAAEAVEPGAAPIQGGTLSGTILDQSGAVIPGVVLNMSAQSTGIIRRTLSNISGNFTFAELPLDSYSVTAELPGFQKSILHYALSDPGSTARFIFTLKLAPFFSVIDIATQAPPGLKCFSVFGAFKSDGTPFTEADCPGGTVFIAPPKPPGVEPAPSEVVMVNSPPATTPAPGQRPLRVGGSVQGGSLVSHPSPSYPQEARNKGVQGTVMVAGVIYEDGHMGSLQIVSSSNPLLETSVVETLQNWLYKPTLLNGTPVESTTVITLNFTLGR